MTNKKPAVQAKAKRRGRPLGYKNKPTSQISDFQNTLNEWDAAEKKVDFKDLCQKLQNALAKSYVEAENLERTVAYLQNEVSARDIVIRYLEGRRNENTPV